MVAHLGHITAIYIYIFLVLLAETKTESISTCGNKIKDFILLGKIKNIFSYLGKQLQIYFYLLKQSQRFSFA